jgi:hypothetical protein
LTIRDGVTCEQRIFEVVLRDTILDHSTLRVSADRDVSKSRHIRKVMFHVSFQNVTGVLTLAASSRPA